MRHRPADIRPEDHPPAIDTGTQRRLDIRCLPRGDRHDGARVDALGFGGVRERIDDQHGAIEGLPTRNGRDRGAHGHVGLQIQQQGGPAPGPGKRLVERGDLPLGDASATLLQAQLVQVGTSMAGNPPCARRRSVERLVMQEDDLAIGGQAHVNLDQHG